MIKIEYFVATDYNLDFLCSVVGLERKQCETDIELRKRLILRHNNNKLNEFKYSLRNIYS